MTQAEFPVEGVVLTHLLVVSNMDAIAAFLSRYTGSSSLPRVWWHIVRAEFSGKLVTAGTGGGPTKDKPTVTFAPPVDPNTVTHELTLRVPDCHSAYETLKARGAVFLTPPVDWGGEFAAFSVTLMGTCWKSARQCKGPYRTISDDTS